MDLGSFKLVVIAGAGGRTSCEISYPSPDSRRIAISSPESDRRSSVHILDVESRFSRTLDGVQGAAMAWSADGKTLYFLARDMDALPELWKIPIEGGEAARLTFSGGGGAELTKDGRWLYFTKGFARVIEQGLWRMPAHGGEVEKVFDRGRTLAWALTRDGACFVRWRPAPGLDCWDESIGVAREVSTLEEPLKEGRLGGWTGSGISVSPDGRYVLITIDATEVDIAMAENFR